MKPFACLIAAVLWLQTGSPAAQMTITVGQGGGYDYETIQAAIDAASPGDTVLVYPGTYAENVKFNRRIVLRSTDPTDTATVAKTIISGNWKGPVVEFIGLEPPTSILAGFTIRYGYNPEGGGGIHSPKSIEHPNLSTAATIEHNVIEFNTGWGRNSGGGIYGCDGIIRNNVIIHNDTGFAGGGLSDCDGFITGNTIAKNQANSGGGLHGCDGVVRGNFISENEAYHDGGGAAYCNGWIESNTFVSNLADFGGGLWESKGLVQGSTFLRNRAIRGGGAGLCQAQNNLILGNAASYGGGLYDAIAFNNTIVGNHAKKAGGGLYDCRRIRNCIIWENTSESSGTAQLSECTSPAFSCIQNWTGGGSANIVDTPLFEDPDGSDNDPATLDDNVYRLLRGSPCIELGKNVFLVPDSVGEDIQYRLAYLGVAPMLGADLDGNCRLAGSYFDMGCYEFGSTLDSDGDLLSNAREVQLGTDPEKIDTDKDGLADGVEVLRKSKPLEMTQPGLISIPADFRSPEEALMAALPRDEVVIAPGVYFGTTYIIEKQIVLRSTDPTSPAVVRSTIIDAAGDGAVVQLDGRGKHDCIIAGLTLRNGRNDKGGGGISGTYEGSLERAQIRISHNIIEANFATLGGGISGCVGLIEHNVIRHNRSWYDGGGLYDCRGTIRGNIVSGNVARWFGGGLADCLEDIRNNRITGNLATSGGGLSGCNGQIRNNTIAFNAARDSIGGMRLCTGRIENCIVWGNSAAAGPVLDESSTPTFSCIENWTGGGEGNIAVDPRFIDPDGPDDDPATWEDNDYRLAFGSPCIDAGDPDPAQNDAYRPPGLRGARNDMGAYGGPNNDLWPAPPPVDLTGRLSGVSQRPLIIGREIAFEGFVTNQGDLAATAGATIELWATDVHWNRSTLLCDPIELGPLSAGEVVDLATLLPPPLVDPRIPPGDYTIEMRVRRNAALPEWDETNNTARWGPVAILADEANLAVSMLDFSPGVIGAGGGDPVAFSGAVVNNGTQPTGGRFWIEFRVAPVGKPDPPWPYLCDSILVTEPLEPGGRIDIAAYPRTAYVTPPGIYTVGIVIDPLDEVAEQREDDNVRWIRHRKLYVGVQPARAKAWALYR